MSGRLTDSPEKVVQWLLIARALGTSPSLSPLQDWPVYSPIEPGTPDDVITVTGTTGVTHGRNHVTGEMGEHYGISIRVRSAIKDDGYEKASEIADTLNRSVYHEIVSIGPEDYCVQSIRTIGSVLHLGYQVPESKRHLFVVNCLADIKQLVS